MRRFHVQVVLLVVALVAAGPLGVAQGGQDEDDEEVDWPPGSWVAEFVVEGGIGASGQTTYLGGVLRMELSIDPGGAVVGGKLVTVPFGGLNGLSIEAETTDPAPGQLILDVVIDMQLAGAADFVEASGPWTGTGVFRSPEIEVPTTWDWDASFPILPDEASCVSVWGDLIDPTLLVESGAIVTVTASYLALPTGVGGEDDPDLGDIVDEVQKLTDALLDGGSPTADEILYLVRLVQAATGEIVRSGLCDEIDEQAAAAANGWFETLMQDLLSTVFLTLDSRGDAYTTQDLIELLHAGVSVGAVGASTVDQVRAEALLQRFEFWLTVRAEEAYGAGDAATLITLAVTGSQYGMQDLENTAMSLYNDLEGIP
jgi:hypothetical protein